MNTCATCRWWQGEEDLGYCKRFPPLVVVINSESETEFPVMRHDDHCGEHSPIPKPKAEADGEYSKDFLAFWQIYPPRRKTNKPGAWKAWKAAVKSGVKPETILDAVAEFAKSTQGRGEFCRGPLPWLNQRAWEDDRNSWYDDEPAPKKLPELPEE